MTLRDPRTGRFCAPASKANCLHIIRVDVFLYALGGFEQRRDHYREPGGIYTDNQVRQIKKLAQRKYPPGGAGGELLRQATLLGMPYKSLLTLLSRVRHGTAPKAWSAVA